MVVYPGSLNLFCCLVFLEETACQKATDRGLDRHCLRGKSGLVRVKARIAEMIATLTTVGGPLETVVTLRPLDSLFFINTTTTENLCTRNGVGATDARHLGWIKKYRVGCLFFDSNLSNEGLPLELFRKPRPILIEGPAFVFHPFELFFYTF